MLTIEELETAYNTSQPAKLPRHEIEGPELSLEAMYYPYGFPVEVKTNSRRVLEQFEKMWRKFDKQHETAPIRCEVQLIGSSLTECPPEPTYRLMLPLANRNRRNRMREVARMSSRKLGSSFGRLEGSSRR